MAPRILALAGSLREGSYNKKLARATAAWAEEAGASVTEIDLRDYAMPIYDADIEESDGLPETTRALKKLFEEHDGLILACPEYNSSITAVLKNTLDWLSRREGEEQSMVAFDGKVAILLSASPGALGGLRGLTHIRTILTTLGVLVLPNQMAVPRAYEAFDAEGGLVDDRQRARVHRLAERLVTTIARLSGDPGGA